VPNFPAVPTKRIPKLLAKADILFSVKSVFIAVNFLSKYLYTLALFVVVFLVPTYKAPP
jgi:hypothetical protein